MRPILYCLVIFTIFFTTAQAQDSPTLKRTAYTLTVFTDTKASYYEEEIAATPYLLPDNSLQLYPGEHVFIEATEENGIIKILRAVKEIRNPDITITINFYQMSEERIHKLMMLQVHNPFSKKLIYDTKMYTLNRRQWLDTDIYPVEAGLLGIETWPDIIISLALSNWRFVDK